MKNKLKKCPFCGGEAHVFENETQKEYYVRCRKCYARTDVYRVSKADAIAAWNQRAVEPTFTREELEFIIALCNEYEVGECPSILRKCAAALKGSCYENGK
jgi:restriction alleviation protein, lar family|nr:MAG TPA: restriction alleviation protein [Caudoviricetes sp.]